MKVLKQNYRFVEDGQEHLVVINDIGEARQAPSSTVVWVTVKRAARLINRTEPVVYTRIYDGRFKHRFVKTEDNVRARRGLCVVLLSDVEAVRAESLKGGTFGEVLADGIRRSDHQAAKVPRLSQELDALAVQFARALRKKGIRHVLL